MLLRYHNVVKRTEDPAKIAELIEVGFKPVAIDPEPVPEPETPPAPTPPEELSKAELLRLAKIAEIKGASSMTKAQLFEELFGGNDD